MTKVVKLATLYVRPTLFTAQLQFVEDGTPFTAFVGGVGSGKTHAGAAKSLKYISQYPGSIGLITAPTFPMLRDATLRKCVDLFPKEVIQEFNKSEMRLLLVNGSELWFRSTDEPEHLRGPSVAFFWMDEAALSKEEAFLILQGRIRQEQMPHQGWITTTPKGFNWVYTRFVAQPGEDYKLYQCSARENQFLPDEYIAHLEKSYRAEFALQEIEGRFVVTGGNCVFDASILKVWLSEARRPLEIRQGLISVFKQAVIGRKYVGFADVAEGVGQDESALVVFDWQTGEQVAEISGNIAPDEFALLCVELCKEYRNAFLGIESNAVGQAVVLKVKELGYRQYEQAGKLGWKTTLGNKGLMVAELDESIRKQMIRLVSQKAIEQCLSFIRDDRGRLGASVGAHDDLVIACAGAVQMMKQPQAGRYELKAIEYARFR